MILRSALNKLKSYWYEKESILISDESSTLISGLLVGLNAFDLTIDLKSELNAFDSPVILKYLLFSINIILLI